MTSAIIHDSDVTELQRRPLGRLVGVLSSTGQAVTKRGAGPWTLSDPPHSLVSPPPLDDRDKYAVLDISAEDQFEGERRHWVLVLHMEDSIEGKVWQVTGDADAGQAYEHRTCAKIGEGGGRLDLYRLCKVPLSQWGVVDEAVEQAASQVPPPNNKRFEKKETVKTGIWRCCQEWSIDVADILARQGLVDVQRISGVRGKLGELSNCQIQSSASTKAVQ